MDNNVIFNAKLAGNIPPKLQIQFGNEGQDLKYNGKTIEQILASPHNPIIWEGDLDINSKAIISLLDRTITRGGDDAIPDNICVSVGQEFTIKKTAEENKYQCRYLDGNHTFKNVSTITLQAQANMIKMKLDQFYKN